MSDNKEQFYTDILTEKIYTAKSSDSEDKIDNQLQEFFKEINQRKRNEPEEGGLQATMIIYSKTFAAKINEKDGTGMHPTASVNLLKYIRDDFPYLTDEGIKEFDLYPNERNLLETSAMEFVILAGEEKLIIPIWSYKKESIFELKMLKKIISMCTEIMKANIYKNIEIGIHTPNINISFEEFTTEKGKKMLEEIEKNIKK